MHSLLLSLLLATTGADAGVEPRTYVQGSTVHLRQAPAPDAQSLEKLTIGMECLVLEPPQGEWQKVRCGEKEGYASASLLGPEKPSLEKLKAEASDPKRKLAQRQESALRAATLAPEDLELQKQLGTLFFERNFELLAGLKKPPKVPEFSFTCAWQLKNAADCLREVTANSVKDVKARAETKKNFFIVAVGNPTQIAVYRGRFRFNTKTHKLTGEVLERTRFESTDVLEKAIFLGLRPGSSDERTPALGQFVLDDASQALLTALPREWGLLKLSRDKIPEMQIDDCLKRPFELRFVPNIHGRWQLVTESTAGLSGLWISAVSRRGRELELTLQEVLGPSSQQVFTLPQEEDDIAHFGGEMYSFELERYPEKHFPCREGGP